MSLTIGTDTEGKHTRSLPFPESGTQRRGKPFPADLPLRGLIGKYQIRAQSVGPLPIAPVNLEPGTGRSVYQFKGILGIEYPKIPVSTQALAHQFKGRFHRLPVDHRLHKTRRDYRSLKPRPM